MSDRGPLVFESQRLLMHPFTLGDAKPVGDILRNPKVAFWRRRPLRLPLVRAQLKHSKMLNRQGLGSWLMFDKDDGALVGDVLLQPQDDTHDIELGYHILPHMWGNGYATEAGARLLTHAFATLHLPRVCAFILARNRASLRVIEKLGFNQHGSHLHAGLVHRYFRLDREEYVRRSLATPADRNRST